MLDVCDFRVIGELTENPHHLLLVGDDGQYYAYDLVSGEILPLQPDDSWSVDVTHPAYLCVAAPEDRVAS
jgi:hypothetical protein